MDSDLHISIKSLTIDTGTREKIKELFIAPVRQSAECVESGINAE